MFFKCSFVCVFKLGLTLISLNVMYLVVPGEKKLGKVITPDTWKDGARNTTGEVRTQIQLQELIV